MRVIVVFCLGVRAYVVGKGRFLFLFFKRLNLLLKASPVLSIDCIALSSLKDSDIRVHLVPFSQTRRTIKRSSSGEKGGKNPM